MNDKLSTCYQLPATRHFHTPVMTREVIEYLEISPQKKYLDATVGGAGHASEIVRQGGIVLGIDHDPEAITVAQKRLENACSAPHQKMWGSALYKTSANKAIKSSQPFQLVLDNFNHLKDIVDKYKFFPLSGILFDLGASTYQLTDPNRGFSFRSDSPLDMRMDPTLGVTAQDLINALSKKELYELFTKLAQERAAWAIATRIVSARRQKLITTTKELADLVVQVSRPRGKIHPATKVFQALRIAVNDELYNLKTALPQAIDLLEPGGRLVVISFHEGEDRIVKHFFIAEKLKGTINLLTKKPLRPSNQELATNPNSRSARFRAIQKI